MPQTNGPQRFYSLGFGVGFSVALQSNYEEGRCAGEFLRKSVPPLFLNEEKRQIFHPAERLENGGAVELIFRLATNGQEKWKQLVFRATNYTRAARFGENDVFGFDRLTPGVGYDYLRLAFPGKTGKFKSVYFKIKTRGDVFVYLRVSTAENYSGDSVLVKCCPVGALVCPPHLQKYSFK